MEEVARPSEKPSGIKMQDVVYRRENSASSWALRVANAHWDLGLTHVIIGLSGSGKSTLLKIVMGLMRPQSGAVSLDPTLQKIGYVVQEGGLFPHLNVEDNLLLPIRSRDSSTKNHFSPRYRSQEITSSMIKRRDEMLDLVSLSPNLLKRFPHELSGGQKQRVSIARALMLDPSLILLDEPLGALDPITRWDLQRELKSIFNRMRKTVMLITHDMNEALYFGHSITVMDEGQIVQKASDKEILERPANDFVKRLLETRSGAHS
jgi:osmoprotectant transport system ATP-binding protein